ncbi:LysR family transcriptional regulator, partial [Xanthomonas citri pv. citri]|nr:LysR family transcriptional regulator [Xanthomonas citri pv. citri]
MLVDFRQLETFVEVCEQMSFTKAASNLYIS